MGTAWAGKKMREKLAELCHQQWSAWMQHMFSECDATMPIILSALEDGSLIIPAEYVKNLRRLMITPYSELSEDERDSDRKEADRLLAIIEVAEPEEV